MERISYDQIPKGMYDAMYQMGTYLTGTKLDHKFLHLMDYRISQINDCAYCMDMHFKECVHADESELRLSTVSAWRETSFFSEKERAILAYAEALTNLSENKVGDEIFEPLKRHLSIEDIAHLTMAIVRINGWNRLMKAFKSTPGLYKVGMYD